MRDYQTKANQGGLPDSITAEKFGAGEANSVLTENKTAVSSSGQMLAIADGTSESTDQLAKALAIYGAGGAEYCLDTGAVNAYVLNPVSPKKAIPAYFDGMTLSFKPGTDNTGAATVNYNSIGVKSITDIDGIALIGGEIAKSVTIRFNSSADRFEIVSSVIDTRDLQGYVNGGELSNGSDSDHDIDITSVVATLTNGSFFKIFSNASPPTKQIDANWAEGDNAGGFPSGLSLAANTHYNFFLIGKTDGTLDAGFDTSNTAVNLLADASGYTWYRRIMSVFTDGSSNIRAFIQNGDIVEYVSRITDVSDSTITTNVYETGTLTVPPGQRAMFIYDVAGEHSGTGVRSRQADRYIADTNEDRVKLESDTPVTDYVATTPQIFSSEFKFFVDSSRQLKYKIVSNNLANVIVQIITTGWTDDRGRN
jgi:hypothetical protein